MTDVEARLSDSIERIFGRACEFAWLSGTFAYDGAKPEASDIDVVLVFPGPKSADAARLAQIRAFVGVYLELHRDSRLRPDLDFPGEYLSRPALDAAIAGRAFTIEAGAITLPPVPSEHYWLEDWRRWYRAWLGMAAFSRFLAGERDAFETLKLKAWKTILSFVLLRAPDALAPSDAVARLSCFGVKPSYRTFAAVEQPWIEAAFESLVADGLAVRSGDRYSAVSGAMLRWEKSVVTLCDAPADHHTLFLSPHQTSELADHARTLWSAPG